MAFRGVAAEDDGLGATLGGAGACFLVPESTSTVHVIYLCTHMQWEYVGREKALDTGLLK